MNLTDPVEDITKIPRLIVAHAVDYPHGHLIPCHCHRRAQFLYASSGVMTVTTKKGMWVVPPLRAVWIPALLEHQIICSGELSMRTLYVQCGVTPNLPQQCCVVSVPPLLRELILHAVTLTRLYEPNGPEDRIMNVILDMIKTIQVTPLSLPISEDKRLQKISKVLTQNPGDNRSLEEWSRLVGTTSRTLTRLFRVETGMSFVQWRQQVRILEALRQLGNGESVTTVSLNLGYDSLSAFIAMFRKNLGSTPGQYFKE
ncbi:MAG: helix-turn-helix transcriptional regulator [SAR324 cluster bacterium]|nr:helix-turn-helix transcriptional regulator [SAR324 cluster bacterium]